MDNPARRMKQPSCAETRHDCLCRTGMSEKCFRVNKVWEPCAMTLFPDNDTSVKRSQRWWCESNVSLFPKATCRINLLNCFYGFLNGIMQAGMIQC